MVGKRFCFTSGSGLNPHWLYSMPVSAAGSFHIIMSHMRLTVYNQGKRHLKLVGGKCLFTQRQTTENVTLPISCLVRAHSLDRCLFSFCWIISSMMCHIPAAVFDYPRGEDFVEDIWVLQHMVFLTERWVSENTYHTRIHTHAHTHTHTSTHTHTHIHTQHTPLRPNYKDNSKVICVFLSHQKRWKYFCTFFLRQKEWSPLSELRFSSVFN